MDNDSEVGRVFFAIRDMYYNMINAPTLDPAKRSAGTPDLKDLEVANRLLETLEGCVNMHASYASSPRVLFRASESMSREYAKVKHWQKMLNAIYGPKEGS